MKLRLRENSLRLRLNRSEVLGLINIGELEEGVSFGLSPASRLTFRVRIVTDGSPLTASLEGARITVELAAATARAWAEDITVGLYSETDGGLKIAVEKDFRCLELRSHEDETDAYDHPGEIIPCPV